MVRKISIALPDDLYNRLQAVKDRFNISKECQLALETRIEIEELFMKGSNNMKNVIERLKAEKEKLDSKWYDEGQKHAMIEAKNMPYSELREIAKASELEYEEDYADFIYGTEYWKDSNLSCEVKAIKNEDSDFSEEQYLIGWVAGILKFWENVSEQL